MLAKNLFAVGAFDLGFRSFVAVLGEAEDGVVVLPLRQKASLVEHSGDAYMEEIPSSLLRHAATSAGLQAR